MKPILYFILFLSFSCTNKEQETQRKNLDAQQEKRIKDDLMVDSIEKANINKNRIATEVDVINGFREFHIGDNINDKNVNFIRKFRNEAGIIEKQYEFIGHKNNEYYRGLLIDNVTIWTDEKDYIKSVMVNFDKNYYPQLYPALKEDFGIPNGYFNYRIAHYKGELGQSIPEGGKVIGANWSGNNLYLSMEQEDNYCCYFTIGSHANAAEYGIKRELNQNRGMK